MSEIRIKTANPDVITNIPEVLGNIKVKDENGIIRDVKKLYAKNGSGEPSLVWDTTVSQSTQQTTQPPVECPNCASGSEVYYPEIKALGKRWDYCTWKKTGLLSSCWNNNTTNEGYYTTRQQDPNKLNFLPPPPNYVMGEIVSYTVPDRVLVFVNRPLVSGINGHQDKIFYGSQDNSLSCLLECSTASNCQLNQPTTTVCGIGSVTQSIYDVIDDRHLLIDTGCIGTGTLNSKIDSCSTYCYGEPDFNTVCRSVNIMHPLYLPLILEDQSGLCNTQYPDFSFIEPTEVIDPPNLLFANDYQNNNLFLTIKDISVIVEGNCTGNSGTAWTFRLFLPIYVNLPTFRNRYIVVMSTLNDIIQGLLNGSSVNIGLITPGNPNYNPVVHAVYKVLSGQTKISQAIYSSNETTDRWAIIGYPKIPTDLPVPYQNYATHCVMVEISSTSENENGDGCNYCANTPEKSSFKASNLRFYPLENKNLAPGDYATPLNYYGYNINKISYFTGYNDIDQMNEVYSECYEGLGIYYGKTYLNTPQLSFQDFYNAYYQPYITTIEAQDCNTICL